MKYVIKESAYTYAILPKEFIERPAYGFDYTDELNEATTFDSVMEAINALLIREVARASSIPSVDRFTIIGVKEVNQPRYEEVSL